MTTLKLTIFIVVFSTAIILTCVYFQPALLSDYKQYFLLQNPKSGGIVDSSNVSKVNAFVGLRNDDDSTRASEMSKKVRVLIWVMTSPQNLDTKTKYIKKTWGPRANMILYMSSKTNNTFPTIGLNVSEGREHLFAKTQQAFYYVYKHHFNDADWFMKTDDDTYVIVENLRYFLSDKDPKDPVYYGQLFKWKVKQGFYSGGAGYVLSREALRRLATNGSDPRVCPQDGNEEDVKLGQCLEKLGVKTASSLDRYGRTRFHFDKPEIYLREILPGWYRKRTNNSIRGGLDSVSDYGISFHYISGPSMLSLDFLIYHLRPYGIRFGNRELNPSRSVNESTKSID